MEIPPEENNFYAYVELNEKSNRSMKSNNSNSSCEVDENSDESNDLSEKISMADAV